MKITRSVALAVTAALAATALAACGSGSGGSTAASSGVLNVGMPNGPQTENHNPFLISSAASSLGYRRVIYEPLVMTNVVKPTEPGEPWLATEWEWSTDYKTLTLSIRDGVSFSDGQPMSAE